MKGTQHKVASTIDVAKLAGVSHMTVARVFSGSGCVAAKTREQVLNAARQVNFRPNPLARGLRGGATRTIGVFWSLINPSGLMASRIANRLRAHDYVPYLVDQEQTAKRMVLTLEDLRRRGTDGLVVQAPEDVLSDPAALDVLGAFPAVVVVRMSPGSVRFDEIVHDRLEAFREVARHFLRTGRRRPAFMGNLAGNRQKWQAFAQVLSEGGIHVSDASCIDLAAFWPSDCIATLDKRFGKTFPFDSLVCTSDKLAVPSMHWLKSRGTRIPEDVAVVGANNRSMAPFFDPPLASIERKDDDIIEHIETMLFRRIANPGCPPDRATVRMSFLWRESAG